MFLYHIINRITYPEEKDLQFVSVYEFAAASQSYGHKDFDAYYQMWDDFIERSVDTSKKIVFGYSTHADYEENARFLPYYQQLHPDREVELVNTDTLDDLLRVLGRSSVVVAARMHIFILDYGFDNRQVVFPISEKLRSYDKMYVASRPDIAKIQGQVSRMLDSILDETEHGANPRGR